MLVDMRRLIYGLVERLQALNVLYYRRRYMLLLLEVIIYYLIRVVIYYIRKGLMAYIDKYDKIRYYIGSSKAGRIYNILGLVSDIIYIVIIVRLSMYICKEVMWL